MREGENTMQIAIEQDIRQFVIQNFLFGRGDQLRNDESFLESGVIDSTGVLELVSFLQEKFGVSIEDDELVPANLDSVELVTSFIERKLAVQKEQRLAG
jgi:acyl carrier protein